MLRKISIFLLYVCLTQMLFAQDETTIKQLCYNLTGSQVFQDCRKFRDDFEKMNLELANHPKMKGTQYEELRKAYNGIQKQYTEFVGTFRADMANYNTVKRMARDSMEFAKGYEADFAALREAYENEYLPVYYKLKPKEGKVIPPALISVGIDLFVKVIDVIKKRQSAKDEAMNIVLGTINENFYKKLEMKRWFELVPPYDEMKRTVSNEEGNTKPDSDNGGTGNANASSGGNNDADGGGDNDEDENEDPVEISPAIFSEMAGFVEFVYLDKNQKQQNMDFSKGGAKEIDVQELNGGGSTSLNSFHFISKEEFGNGTQFLLRVNNSAGMYVFALNSGNKVRFLYPYENDKIGNCQGAKTKQKDIDVKELQSTLVVGQDDEGNTILPIPDCSFAPPHPRYFTISGNATSENFCIILSKSEIDTKALAEEIEEEEGELNERLTKIFGTEAISAEEAQLEMENNRLNFDASAVEKEVLPIVFLIKRK